MRFSPDKQPRRLRKPAPKEVLDIPRVEEKFSFDPELDIPAETWKLIDETLESVPEGKEVGFFLEVVSLASVLAIILPEHLSKLRDNTRFKEKVLEHFKKFLASTGVTVDILPEAIWIFPDLRAELVDLSQPSLVQSLQVLVGKRRPKVDFALRDTSVLALDSFLAMESIPMSQVVAHMKFLKSFFPDGGKIISDSMRKAKMTEAGLLFELTEYRTTQENHLHLMSFLDLLFPDLKIRLKERAREKEVDALKELRQYLRRGVSEKSKLSEYAKAALAYAVLTADSTTFDESGIQLTWNQGEVPNSKPLPDRSEI